MFRYADFLKDNFKTASGVIAFLTAYGVDAPSLPTVDKWFSRDTIPSAWLPVLLAYLELEQGQAVSLKSYVRRAHV